MSGTPTHRNTEAGSEMTGELVHGRLKKQTKKI